MPLFDYMNEDKEIVEVLYNSGENVPETINKNGTIYHKLPPVTQRPRFNGTGFYETDYK